MQGRWQLQQAREKLEIRGMDVIKMTIAEILFTLNDGGLSASGIEPRAH